ncbi:aspartyl protease family protein [Sphingomonas sp. MMS12-HWE2-04]|uniref:aspartyl protease family protein n=1 Tax=Sphingomonas sp. MMS12-HWE2-04 TaxID=3234199 RepID=UPI00384C2525
MLLLLPLALSSATPAGPPQKTVAQKSETVLTPDTEARWVPFEVTAGNQLRFAAQVDGVPARGVLDTGLSDTIVTARFARTLALKSVHREQATAIGGSVTLDWAALKSLSFGGLQRRGGRVGIAGAGGEARFEADIFIGADVLGCCALEIDYDARRFRLLRSGRMPLTGTTAPLSRARPSGVFLSEVTLGGRRLRPVILDTGDGSSVTLTRSAWGSTGARGVAVTTTLGWGVGGALVSDVAIVPGLGLAGVAPPETEVRIEDDKGYSARVGAAGRIGNGLLGRFHVLLDPSAGRLVVSPGTARDAAPPRSTSGLLLGAAADQLRVLHVMRGSPAALAGWREGETICAVDGVAVPQLVARGDAIGWGARAPGMIVRLTLCDGRERSLTLRRFY